MTYQLLRPAARTPEHAVALLIVLAFLLLLAGLVVAYLSRTGTERQVAHTSFNDAKSDQLARSALDIIVADFRQEIAASGTPPVNGNIGPQRSPKPDSGSTPAIPNLIRRSVRSDTISGPAVPSHASAVNSTTDASLNGRSISLARWNSHYLVAKSNPNDNTSDPITSGFSGPNYWAPDWVIVTRSGPTGFNRWNASLSDATISNSSYAIGRYAFIVYDEGGLCDANVVGLPSPTPPATEIGRKGSAALADLTAMKLTSGGSTPNPTTLSIGAAIIVNLNTQNPAVIAALLKGTITAEPSGSPLALTASNNAAASPTPNPNIGIIADATTGSEGTLHTPAVGRRDIPRLVAAAGNYISSATEEQKETISRALGKMTQTLTWGLMIDFDRAIRALSANRKHPF